MLYFADVVLEYFDSGTGSLPGPYGFYDPNGNGFLEPGEPPVPSPTTVNAALYDEVDPAVNVLSLPTGSCITLGFTQGYAIDGPGNDIFIRESGPAGDRAEVYISSVANPTGADFVLLGIAQDDITTSFDLASIGFTEPVRAIRLIGLDNKGRSPGFDIVNVQALQVMTAQGDRILAGNSDSEQLLGGVGNDQLTGNDGNDGLVGDQGNDLLSGSNGNDLLQGGDGNDWLDGGSGSDRCFCGSGKDIVFLERERSDRDIIQDFRDKQDKFAFDQRISFGKLSIQQRGKDAQIFYRNDLLAVVKGVDADDITRTDFKIIESSMN